MKCVIRKQRRALIILPILLLLLCSGACAQEHQSVASEQQKAKVLLRADSSTSDSLRPKFAPDSFVRQRARMVDEQIAANGVNDEAVLKAMRRVPRHLFIPKESLRLAYGDHPVPIGHGQTISQPYIVAYMTELLDLQPTDKVLEIGTGSAYQAAILAELVGSVYTIEIVDPLAQSAAERIKHLGYENITSISGDGYFGWAKDSPYDAIIVTAAAEHIPPPLIAQLKEGGKMVIPVGRTGWTQNLLLVEKSSEGKVTTKNLLPVRFVPLTRRE